MTALIQGYERLTKAIVIQAMVDYFSSHDKSERDTILSELKSEQMALLTDTLGMETANLIETKPRETENILRMQYDMSKYCYLADKRVCCSDNCTKCAKMMYNKLKSMIVGDYILKEDIVSKYGIGGYKLLRRHNYVTPKGKVNGKKQVKLMD